MFFKGLQEFEGTVEPVRVPCGDLVFHLAGPEFELLAEALDGHDAAAFVCRVEGGLGFGLREAEVEFELVLGVCCPFVTPLADGLGAGLRKPLGSGGLAEEDAAMDKHPVLHGALFWDVDGVRSKCVGVYELHVVVVVVWVLRRSMAARLAVRNGLVAFSLNVLRVELALRNLVLSNALALPERTSRTPTT